jgi:hypothetical protein
VPDFDQAQVGGVVLPLSTTSENSLLRDADPSLFFFLDFIKYVINTYPGPRLVQALQEAGITYASQQINAAVAMEYPYEPLPEQLENQFQFPLLAAFRGDIKTEQFTVGHETDSTVLTVLYVLPPMDAAGTERILPIFNSIQKALRRKITDAWDPGYTPPGGNPGDQFSAAPYANVEAIGFGEDRDYAQGRLSNMGSHGYLQSGGGLYFPCLRLQAYVRERDMYNPTQGGPSKFAGADITGNVLADDGTKVLATSSGVVQVSTQPAPFISGISVATGPYTGGTTFTLSGANFLAGPPTVFFGPVNDPTYSAGVTNFSPNSLNVTTPAMLGAGTVDVTIVNRDGQSFTLKGAFTFV